MITVRFLASLRERLGRSDAVLDATSALTVREVWARVSGGLPMPDNTLVAVNCEYVDAAAYAHDGDEVAFFPPVTGG